jgi:hypothetical protein
MGRDRGAQDELTVEVVQSPSRGAWRTMISTVLRSWWLWFLVAWIVCIVGVVVATRRGFDSHPFGAFAGKFLVGATVVSWLGLTGALTTPLQSAVRRVLSGRLGSATVALGLAATGVLLLLWSRGQLLVRLHCRNPANATVWIDGEKLPCESKIWTSPDAMLLAYADGFQTVEKRVKSVPTDHGALVLELTEVARWSCSLHGGAVDDRELFVACGTSTKKAPWTRSRTWALNVVLRENARARVSRPTLQIAARQNGTAVAIQSTHEDCFARADEHKAPNRDEIKLSGCGHDGDYSVNVTVCTSGELPITSNVAHWINFKVREGDDEQSYECVVSGAGALVRGNTNK